MKRMLWMLPLLFAGMTAAAQNQDMARLGTYMSNGEFVVGTAETVLAADITVRCEKIVCGPYARYAQKFLGLRAPLTDKTVYTVADAAIAHALGEFKGVGRRFQRYGEVALAAGGQFTLVDDYGHHPAEMRATIAAARGAFPGRRLMLAFQPHRYTRTRDCFEDFVSVLNGVDALVLAEVYAAGEAPIVAADSRSLARALRVAGKIEPVFVEDIADVPQAILDVARDGDVVITMGAGSIGAVPGKLAGA